MRKYHQIDVYIYQSVVAKISYQFLCICVVNLKANIL